MTVCIIALSPYMECDALAFNNAISDAPNVAESGKMFGQETHWLNSVPIRIRMLELITFVAVTSELSRVSVEQSMKRFRSDWEVSDIIFGWLDNVRCFSFVRTMTTALILPFLCWWALVALPTLTILSHCSLIRIGIWHLTLARTSSKQNHVLCIWSNDCRPKDLWN